MEKLISLVKKGADEIAAIKQIEIELGNLIFHSNKSFEEKNLYAKQLLKNQLTLVSDESNHSKHISKFIGKINFSQLNRNNQQLTEAVLKLSKEIIIRNSKLRKIEITQENYSSFIDTLIGRFGNNQTSGVHKWCDIIDAEYKSEEDVILSLLRTLNSWPCRIIVVRHGTSAQNKALELQQKGISAYAYEDTTDSQIPLAEEGFFQAQETGKYLKKMFTDSGIKIDYCYVSPYLRTIQTATGIISYLGQNPHIEERDELREKEFGVEHGLSANKLKERFPTDAMLKQRDSKFFYRPHGGESYQDVRQRVRDFMGTLKRKNTNQTVLIVTHQVTYKVFRSLIEGDTVSKISSYPYTPNCGIAIYEIDKTQDKPHLKLIKYDLVGYQ